MYWSLEEEFCLDSIANAMSVNRSKQQHGIYGIGTRRIYRLQGRLVTSERWVEEEEAGTRRSVRGERPRSQEPGLCYYE